MINFLIRHRTRMLAISIGIVYLWFGALKFFPGVSPAEFLAKETLDKLLFGLIPTRSIYFVLALWEVTIGVFLLLNIKNKWMIYAAMIHLTFSFTPLLVLSSLAFKQEFSLTLIGQYIIKDVVLFSAFLFLLPQVKNPARVIY